MRGDLPQVQGYGYLAGKTAQERVARQESPDLTIVRSTQWFEFAGQNLDRMKLAPIALVPARTIQPVALDAVADVIAAFALGDRTGALHEVAGPEVTTLWDMTTQLPGCASPRCRCASRAATGERSATGPSCPHQGVDVVGPRYTEWLRLPVGSGR